MKYVVTKIGSKQYRISEGDVLLIDKIKDKLDPKVLLFVDGDKVKVGTPHLSTVKLKFKIEDNIVKGKKIDVRKYKAKSRYRKAIGFRPQYSKITLQKIS